MGGVVIPAALYQKLLLQKQKSRLMKPLSFKVKKKKHEGSTASTSPSDQEDLAHHVLHYSGPPTRRPIPSTWRHVSSPLAHLH